MLLVAGAGTASAQPETAEAAFQRGRAAAKAGHIHEACEAYAASEKLAAIAVTELALADCYEQDGKPMSAARMYRKAADQDDNAAQAKTALAKAAKLEARASKLRFAINPKPPGIVIRVDGVAIDGTDEVQVDTGPHDIVAIAPGYEGHASAPVDRERAILDVIIRMEPKAEPTPAPAPAAVPTPAATAAAAAPAAATAPAPTAPAEPTDLATTGHRKRNGIILGAAGVAALVGSAIAYEASSTRFDDVSRLCPSSTCPSMSDLSLAQSKQDDGHTLRGVSIGMGIGGALLVAAGSYLLLTPHHEEQHVSLHVDHSGAAVAYELRF